MGISYILPKKEKKNEKNIYKFLVNSDTISTRRI